LKKHDRDIGLLPIELHTVVRVVSATGVISNGGLRYFFERDWEGEPSYDEFVSAFRTIGAHQIADAIERTVELFGFANPHVDGSRRHERYCQLFESVPEQIEFPLP